MLALYAIMLLPQLSIIKASCPRLVLQSLVLKLDSVPDCNWIITQTFLLRAFLLTILN